MGEWWNNIIGNSNFKQIAFVFAILLLLAAWKFGLEGLGE